MSALKQQHSSLSYGQDKFEKTSPSPVEDPPSKKRSEKNISFGA
jgi:hypothetical protein